MIEISQLIDKGTIILHKHNMISSRVQRNAYLIDHFNAAIFMYVILIVKQKDKTALNNCMY